MMHPAVARIASFLQRRPKTSCALAGAVASFAMAPFFIWPAMMLGLCAAVFVFQRLERARDGAWCAFFFGMGFFVLGLWWVSNALRVDMSIYWWGAGFAVFGLPVLLCICWMLAGYLSVRFTKAGSLARAVSFITLLGAAEYARAFNLSGFPWNLFGYTWANVAPMTQLAALGGAYFVTAATIFWMAAPALAVIAWPRRRARVAIIALAVFTFGAALAFGAWRLSAHPTELRDDVGLVIVQPNITPEEKWRSDQMLDHFLRHVRLSKAGLDSIGTPPAALKSVAIVWPETSLDERLVMTVPEAPRALLEVLQNRPYTVGLVSGIWREVPEGATDAEPGFYNSIGSVSVLAGKLNLDDVYDKHHLVPFGEYVPLEKELNLTPLVGFSGFQKGSGPRALQSPFAPPYAPMICFEAIFPWYGASIGADWLVNTSNDGWYGDTPGPYQHLAMTRYRAIEQGKPIARSATTGISAIIDPYGRVIQSLDYQREGYLVGALPKPISGGTLYAKWGEALFFVILSAGFVIFITLRRRGI